MMMMMMMQKWLALLLLCVAFPLSHGQDVTSDDAAGGIAGAPVDPAGFGFWTSIVQCQNPDAKPRLTFSKIMRCGCAAGGKTAGPCVDQGQEVLKLQNSEVLKIDRELEAPSPAFNGECQQLPQVFLDSGTADSGANFDELWDVAMSSPCAYDPNLEWMGRDCRDSFIPGKGAEGDPATQDRSDPNKLCTIECATLYLKIAELCPRVYQLLRLDQLAPICPELQFVTVPPLPGGPVPLDASVPTVASTPAPSIELPLPTAEIPAPQPIDIPVEVPAVAAVEVPVVSPVEVPVPVAAIPVPEPVIAAPSPASAPPSSTTRSEASFAAASLVAFTLNQWLVG